MQLQGSKTTRPQDGEVLEVVDGLRLLVISAIVTAAGSHCDKSGSYHAFSGSSVRNVKLASLSCVLIVRSTCGKSLLYQGIGTQLSLPVVGERVPGLGNIRLHVYAWRSAANRNRSLVFVAVSFSHTRRRASSQEVFTSDSRSAKQSVSQSMQRPKSPPNARSNHSPS